MSRRRLFTRLRLPPEVIYDAQSSLDRITFGSQKYPTPPMPASHLDVAQDQRRFET